MGTRSIILVHDDNDVAQVYRHWDGYPSGVLSDIDTALTYAWALPRYEASDMTGAIVCAMKGTGGGNIYVETSPDRSKMFAGVHGDIDWVYVITNKIEIDEAPVVIVYDWPFTINGVNVWELQQIPGFFPTPTAIVPIKQCAEAGGILELNADGDTPNTQYKPTDEQIATLRKWLAPEPELPAGVNGLEPGLGSPVVKEDTDEATAND